MWSFRITHLLTLLCGVLGWFLSCVGLAHPSTPSSSCLPAYHFPLSVAVASCFGYLATRLAGVRTWQDSTVNEGRGVLMGTGDGFLVAKATVDSVPSLLTVSLCLHSPTLPGFKEGRREGRHCCFLYVLLHRGRLLILWMDSILDQSQQPIDFSVFIILAVVLCVCPPSTHTLSEGNKDWLMELKQISWVHYGPRW